MKPYALCLAVLLFAGCNTGQSYTEALATLTLEKELLAELESERAEVDASMRSRIQDNVDLLTDMDKKLRNETSKLYDLAMQTSGETSKQILADAERMTEKSKAFADEQRSKMQTLNRQIQEDAQARIAELDAEIDKQRAVVAKAEESKESLADN